MTDKEFLQSLQIALTAAEKTCGKKSAAYTIAEIMYAQVQYELASRAQERDKSIEAKDKAEIITPHSSLLTPHS